jgi:hypothetical protein
MALKAVLFGHQRQGLQAVREIASLATGQALVSDLESLVPSFSLLEL